MRPGSHALTVAVLMALIVVVILLLPGLCVSTAVEPY